VIKRPEEFDPADPNFIQYPYDWYAHLRAKDPVHYVESMEMFWVTRYKDVTEVLSSNKFCHHANTEGKGALKMDMAQELWSKSMLYSDPPDHTRLRSLVNKAFVPRIIENLRTNIEGLCSSLLGSIDTSGPFDLMKEFAAPFPALVIADLLGVDISYRERFKDWSNDIIKGMDSSLSQSEWTKSMNATMALASYFIDLIDEKKRNPGNDLVSQLIEAEEKDDRMNPEELLGMCLLLLVAGHETTTNLIGNGFYNLLKHGDKFNELRADRSFMQTAIEEMLRFESPVQRMGRLAVEELTLSGVKIEKGSMVAGVIGSANRDPEFFHEPEILDLKREKNQHLAFGKGIHFCLGAPLARLETSIAFNGLLDSFPQARLHGAVEWERNTVMRGLKRLEITA
jgi:pimeloyl-[acyl-carrier protein] synthase